MTTRFGVVVFIGKLKGKLSKSKNVLLKITLKLKKINLI
jgi:hypothetical protein